MTREEVLKYYKVVDGRITSPGKFEGEPIFAPHFWDIGIQGCADSDDGRVFTFRIKRDDPEHKEFPELKRWLGRKRTVRLFEDEQGFVYAR